jgi:16S rRNA processing protein RimM
MDKSDLIVIAQFAKTFGIKGLIKVKSYCEPLDTIYKYFPWYSISNNIAGEIQIENTAHKPSLAVKLVGYDSPEAVKQFTNSLIYTHKDNLPALTDSDYYWFQLHNLEVYTSNNELLGKVNTVFATGSNDVLDIIPTSDSIDKQQRLVPYIDDTVISVDLAAQKIVVNWAKDF